MLALKYPTDFIGITSPFGPRGNGYHYGIDLGWNNAYGGSNAPIHAAFDGTVSAAVDGNGNMPNTASYGNYVRINHAEGYQTLYAHLLKGSLTVKNGDKVKMGQVIGKMNNSGNSTGNHLHYEVRLNTVKVDPIKYTYVYPDQTQSSNTLKKYDLMLVEDIEPTPTIDLLDLVRRTIRGDYGNGQARKNALGENYSEVQRQVNLNYANGTTNWDNVKLY